MALALVAFTAVAEAACALALVALALAAFALRFCLAPVAFLVAAGAPAPPAAAALAKSTALSAAFLGLDRVMVAGVPPMQSTLRRMR